MAVNYQRAKDLALQGKSNQEIGEILDTSEASIRRIFKKFKFDRFDNNYILETTVNLMKPLQVSVDDSPLMVTADYHIPLHSPYWINLMLDKANEIDSHRLLIAGDFLNLDALSAYDPKQYDAGFEYEISQAYEVMEKLANQFDSIYYLWGNHDVRLPRALGYKMRFDKAMKLAFGGLGEEITNKITFSPLDFCIVENGQGLWRVCHPANYSRVPLSNPIRLAAKYDCNVITAHSHHCAIGKGINGNHTVAEAGGLFDRDKTAYLQRSTTFPVWTNGFSYLTSTNIKVIGDGWETDSV